MSAQMLLIKDFMYWFQGLQGEGIFGDHSSMASMLVGHRNRVEVEFAFYFLIWLVVVPRVSIKLAILVKK